MSFELVCEIEPPTKADLRPVRHQIGVLSRVASSFLIPDNHLGRATVSSIAVAAMAQKERCWQQHLFENAGRRRTLRASRHGTSVSRRQLYL